MRRGTTYRHTFTVPIDLSLATVYITYKQGGAIVAEKTNAELEITRNEIVCLLSQEDTLAFKAGEVRVQLRYIMPDGSAGASNVIVVNVSDILKDGMITYGI